MSLFSKYGISSEISLPSTFSVPVNLYSKPIPDDGNVAYYIAGTSITINSYDPSTGVVTGSYYMNISETNSNRYWSAMAYLRNSDTLQETQFFFRDTYGHDISSNNFTINIGADASSINLKLEIQINDYTLRNSYEYLAYE